MNKQALVRTRNHAEIKRLGDSGLSMRAIANEMVRLGYPNLVGGKNWHPMMVSRLIKASDQKKKGQNRLTQA